MFEQIKALLESGIAKVGEKGFSLPMGLVADYGRFTYAELKELSKALSPQQKAELTSHISKTDETMARRLDNYFMGKEENATPVQWPIDDDYFDDDDEDVEDCDCPNCLLDRGEITAEEYNDMTGVDTTMPDMPIILNVNIVLPSGEVLRSQGDIPANAKTVRPKRALKDMDIRELAEKLAEEEKKENFEFCREIQNEIDKKLK